MNDPTSEGINPPGEPAGPPRHRWRRRLGFAAIGLVVLFGLIQLIPYGHSTTNPPVTKAAVWPSAQAQTLAENACYDCHSNLTDWWWGTRIAPMSWLAQSDVNGGREHLNFSEWGSPQPSLDEVTETVQSGSMAPLQYKLIHANARLSDAEKQQLVQGLTELYATDPPPIGGGG